MITKHIQNVRTIWTVQCADQESFVNGGSTLTFFFFLVDEGKEHLNTTESGAIFGPPVKRTPFYNIECWLGSFVIFHGIRTSINKETYSFVIFQAGPNHWSSPPLDPLMSTKGKHLIFK